MMQLLPCVAVIMYTSKQQGRMQCQDAVETKHIMLQPSYAVTVVIQYQRLDPFQDAVEATATTLTPPYAAIVTSFSRQGH